MFTKCEFIGKWKDAMKKILLIISVMTLLAIAGNVIQVEASPPAAGYKAISRLLATQPIIIDHNTVDITAIPQYWIEQAKNTLNIYYGHTSHGSQLISGMDGLIDFANVGGLGLSLPADIFAGLPLQETSPDVGYYPTWVDRTREHLGPPDLVTGRGTTNPDTNVVIWSWCDQVSVITPTKLIDEYLQPMTQLEMDYPGVTFVYITGPADGSGDDPATSNLHARNQQIRQYAIENNKILYDFYDIELYDPDGSYYGDKAVNDECNYDSNGDGWLNANWCDEWQAAHTEGLDWYTVSCAHSRSINCNQKAYAAWWLWARIAGWDGLIGGRQASEQTGNWSAADTWVDGIVPTANDLVTITTGTEVTVDVDTHTHSIVVESGATLIIPEGITITVSESVNNLGTIKQTRVVNNQHAAFIEITDPDGFARYRGAEISTTNDLGQVTVSVRVLSDGESCTTTEISAYAQRCFEILPTFSDVATVRLWALTEEMDSLSIGRVYRYVDPEWVMLESNMEAGEQGVYSYAEAQTPGFSYFLIAQTNSSPALTIDIEGEGSVSMVPLQLVPDSDYQVMLTAVPAPGWIFDFWSGAVDSSDNPLKLDVLDDTSVTVNFTQEEGVIIVEKQTDPDGSTQSFEFSTDYGANFILTDDQIYNSGPLAPGVYSVSEVNIPAGWLLTSVTCNDGSDPSEISLEGGETVICIFENTQEEYSLTVNIAGNGSVTAVPDELTYKYGDPVELNASADPGWYFSGWSGDVTSIDNPLNLTILGDTVITSTFAEEGYFLTVISDHGVVTLDPEGPIYQSGGQVTLTANPDPGWNFSNWSGDASGNDNPLQVTITNNMTVTANYTLDEYTLAVVSDHGAVTRDPDQATYQYGDVVTLTATADPGWYFDFWSGNASGTDNPTQVTITGDMTVTANYAMEGYTLTVISEHGVVTLDPDQPVYQSGALVTLTAAADPGWSFANWSGDAAGVDNPIEITITGNMTVTANCTQDEYTLAVEVIGNGSVTAVPDQLTYHYGDPVELTASADPGWYFSEWSGDLSSTENPLDLTILGNTALTANFMQDITAPQITIQGDNPAEVQVGEPYIDTGATAWDEVDGDLTADIITTSDVDTSTVGTYNVTYEVSDSSGNLASAVRVVYVVEPPTGLIYQEDFESYSPEDNPVDWMDTEPSNSMIEDDSLFQIYDVGGNLVFGTQSTSFFVHSHYVGVGSDGLSGYRYSGRMMITDPRGGIYVTLHSLYPNSDAYYWLTRYGTAPFHIHGRGTSVKGDRSTDVVPVADTWYWFIVEVEDTGSQIEVRAKVWAEGTPEPANWQAEAYDDTGTRITAGTFGVGSLLNGEKYWDDLTVSSLTP